MKNKWLHFDIDKETVFGLACGFVMILLSIAMTFFSGEISSIILRDILMILLLGFLTPVYYILVVKKKSLSVLGIHTNKLAASLAINAAAAVSLLALFISKNTEDIRFTVHSFYAVTYILAAGIFEMVFIYGFLRYECERRLEFFLRFFLPLFFTVCITQAFSRNLQSCFLSESCIFPCFISRTISSRYFRFSGASARFGTFWCIQKQAAS